MIQWWIVLVVLAATAASNVWRAVTAWRHGSHCVAHAQQARAADLLMVMAATYFTWAYADHDDYVFAGLAATIGVMACSRVTLVNRYLDRMNTKRDVLEGKDVDR